MNRSLFLTLVAVVSLLPAAIAHAQPQPDWKAGVAVATITPQGPTWMAGYASRNKPSEGKFQDLFAKAVVLEDAGGTRLVIVTLDLIGIHRDMRAALEQQIAKECGVKPEALLINCSHTHSGPVVRTTTSFYDLSPELQKPVDKYADELPPKVVDLVKRAIADLGPANLGYCRARAGFAMNRRLPTPTGYQNSPNPEGPVDHDVPILRVERPDGKLRAVLFGYACHNTTLALFQFCGDYAGYAQQYIEEAHPGTTALFMIGCGADQNPYPRGKLEMAQQHGRTLANAVEAALMPKPRPIAGPLRVALQEVALEFAPTPREELLKMKEESGKYEKQYAIWLLEQYDKGASIPKSYPCPVQVIRFGDDLLLVAIGGETLVDYSLRLKRELPGPAVWVAGYSNDVFAYVPPARVLKEGGYEATGSVPYYRFPGPFAPSIEDRLIGKVKEMARAPDGK